MLDMPMLTGAKYAKFAVQHSITCIQCVQRRTVGKLLRSHIQELVALDAFFFNSDSDPSGGITCIQCVQRRTVDIFHTPTHAYKLVDGGQSTHHILTYTHTCIQYVYPRVFGSVRKSEEPHYTYIHTYMYTNTRRPVYG